MKNDDARSGFTLLEVMIALVIFSFISVGAFGVLSGLLRAQVSLEEQETQLDNLQRLLLITRHDITQVAPSLSDALQTPPAGTAISLPDANGSLAFVRRGWLNPLDESRSTLASVRYDFTNGVFKRRLWPFAHMNQPDPVSTQSLTDQAENVRFLPLKASDPAPAVTPAALELSITLPAFGEVRQIIPLAQTP